MRNFEAFCQSATEAGTKRRRPYENDFPSYCRQVQVSLFRRSLIFQNLQGSGQIILIVNVQPDIYDGAGPDKKYIYLKNPSGVELFFFYHATKR